MSQLIISNNHGKFIDFSSLISLDPSTHSEPISLQSAAFSLQNAINVNDYKAIMGITQKLIETVWKKNDEQRYMANLLKEHTRELLDLRHRVEGSKPTTVAPPGFELNGINKVLYFLIPI